jgi:hypothetical protein
MTYTFKLARRLAASRQFTMLPVFLVLAACAGDTTAPQGAAGDLPESGIYGWQPRESSPVAVRINPASVTLETNQLIQFKARGRNRAGDDIAAPVSWSTTGGTILPDGRFSAAATGTYQVMGRTRTSDDAFVVDTSTVTVVRRRVGLTSIQLSPDSVTLAPRASQAFSASGRLRTGVTVVIGVNWSATGGTIDPAGIYTAGDTAGQFRVIATNTNGKIADTSLVIISAPPSLPPPSDSTLTPPTIPITPAPPPPDTTTVPVPVDTSTPPPPPPAPVLASVILKPAAWTLATGTSKQFSAFGRTTTGDSIAVAVVFSANGGTVTQGGLFTAGSTAGTFRVIANAGSLADTSSVTITATLGSVITLGVPFGPFASWNETSFKPNTESFNLSHQGFTPANILTRLEVARTAHVAQLLALTGGARSNYLTDGVFDMAKWKAKMDLYNTAAIKAAVAAAVADGTVIGNSVMDEPFNDGGPGNEGNSWGPAGTMTKARVDSMCAYVKGIFPSLAAGAFHDHNDFEPTKSYNVCDFIVAQYRERKGPIQEWRDAALALGRRDGHAVAFSLNILDGGIQAARDGLWNCPLTTTGGQGTYNPNCRMTAAQVRDWGIILGSAGCALTMWRYDAYFMANADNKAAFRDVASRLASLPSTPCRRR